MTQATDPWTAAMRAGRYEDAWAISEAVLRTRDPAGRDDPALPYHRRWVWDGRPFDRREVLVRCYHGLGDTIQFARFLPRLASRAKSVTVEAQPRLLGLLATVPAEAALVPFDPARPLPPAECDIEITELDFALRAAPDAAPDAASVPYLQVASAPLAQGAVAICYAAGAWDCDRNVPPELFTRICERVAAVTVVPEPTALGVLNPSGCAFDIASSAALVAGASLVITVDTMVAHLAGALGRPTWLLLKAEPDWRWNPASATSAWYPSLRQYVQPRPGDWDSVIARVERDLAVHPGLFRRHTQEVS